MRSCFICIFLQLELASFLALKCERSLKKNLDFHFRSFFSHTHTHSVQHFEPILNKLPSTVYGTDYVSDIRAELLHKLHESHDYFWQSKYVDENLQCLHDVVSRSSRQAAGSSDAKAAAWRPTGKTPAEQVSMERTSLICAKLKLMKKLMAKQLAEQQQMVAELESYRGRMEMIQAKRLLLGAQMEMRHAELQTADERLRELSEMLAGMADSSSDSP